jgi:hypothetical protein
MRDVEAVLDALVPAAEHVGDWEAVLRDARGRGTRWAPVALAALVAAIAAGVLFWPASADQGSVLERALAAVGEGPVLHVVYRVEWGGTLVNLETGERRPARAESEIWDDPARGLHTVSRLEGVIQSQHTYRPGERHPPEERLLVDASAYRAALSSGQARVVGDDVVQGRPVYWIQFRGEWNYDVADGREHELAKQVAVDRETYRPVYVREALDGRPVPYTGGAIEVFETLPEEAVDFAKLPSDPLISGRFSEGPVREVGLQEAGETLGRRPVWAGRKLDGLPLASVWEYEYGAGYDARTHPWRERQPALAISYGGVGERPARLYVRPAKPHVLLVETAKPPITGGFRGAGRYRPPEGWLIYFGGFGVARVHGVYVEISGSDERLVVAAARALEPMP